MSTDAICPADLEFQRALLQGVSRTFALTIPVLPAALEPVIGNAYLLCRITDTIEDHAALDPRGQSEFYERFIAVVEGHGDAAAFAHDFGVQLASHASQAERRLIAETPRVLAITARFSREQQAALAECVTVMGRGMAAFQRTKSTAGLSDLDAHAHYCYVVAGCVGEMLTRLFIAYLPELAPRRRELMRLAVSFGQCLQMTNILKDFWEDRAQGACWLPRDVFRAAGVNLATVRAGDPGFARGYRRLLGLARAHAQNSLAYTLALPAREAGLRNFCLWALFMAVLTQRKLLAHPEFASGREVKITRRSVYRAVAWCRFSARRDWLLKASFAWLAHRLPRPHAGDAAPVVIHKEVPPAAKAAP